MARRAHDPEFASGPDPRSDLHRRPVCLVIPPSPFLLDERVFVSLGILRIAAVLEQAGRAVEVVDLSGVENFDEAIAAHAGSSEALVFGLTATTPQMPAARRIVHTLRAVRPNGRILLGGPHVTLVNAAAKRERKCDQAGRANKALSQLHALADVLVAGDGEEAIHLALSPEPPPLVDADDRRSPLFQTDEKLDTLPLPARHLVDLDSYRYFIDGRRATSLIAQLGCPFGCGFCGGRESSAFRIVRTRSVENIVSEVRHLHDTCGYRGFMMYDDELNVSPEMIPLMNALAGVQDKLGADFRLRGFIKSELLTDAQAEAMARAGFRWILVGFESGSPRILTGMNKRATREANIRCIEIARRHGLRVKALMSLGHPGETPETIEETRRWILEVRPDDFDLTIITTYPGTPYYDHAVPADRPGTWTYVAPRTGDRLHSIEVDFTQVADYYKGVPDGGYVAYVFTDALDAEGLVRARDEIERSCRAALGLPRPQPGARSRYEHSMGQFGAALPSSVLRRSEPDAAGSHFATGTLADASLGSAPAADGAAPPG